MGLGPDIAGRLLRCCYGTRDAGAIWESVFAEALCSMGFTQGRASPCCFYYRDLKVSVVVHGEELTALGAHQCLTFANRNWFRS